MIQPLLSVMMGFGVSSCGGSHEDFRRLFRSQNPTEVRSSESQASEMAGVEKDSQDSMMTSMDDDSDPPQMVSYLPTNPKEDHLSRDVFGAVRELVRDEWNTSAVLYEYSFDRLTPTGRSIFEAARQYVKHQKDPQFQEYAQPLQCATNVSYVLTQAGYQIEGDATYSIPHMIEAIEYSGGKVYEIPRYHKSQDNTDEIVSFINTYFEGSLPTGALIVGCKARDCTASELSGGHIGILGDKNEFGELMIYHNNWYRPNHHQGIRMPYMVSLENLYVLLRPREWMATPWMSFTKNSSSEIISIKNSSSAIDDFYILGGDYYIKIVLLPALIQELEQEVYLPVHKNISSGNAHRNIHPKEADWMVCRSKEPLNLMEARVAPYGVLNTQVIYELSGYHQKESMLYDRFEFAILEEQDDWVSALVYDQDRFWGSNDIHGALWLHRSKIQCWPKHDIFRHRQLNPLGVF